MSKRQSGAVLWIDGMICESSAQRLAKALSELDGVWDVRADYERGKVEFSFDDAIIKLKTIKRCIADLGYFANDAPPVRKNVPQPSQASEQKIVRRRLMVDGMTCLSCETRIENGVGRLFGVKSVKASFSASSVKIEFDPQAVSIEQIGAAIGKLGYTVRAGAEKAQPEKKLSASQLAGLVVMVAAGYLIFTRTGLANLTPNVTQNMGYGLLFLAGLLTSLHCVAMCGGINLSQCVSGDAGGRAGRIRPSLLYNAGRVVSYTLIGGVFGAFGSVFSFSGRARGAVAILSGIFMLIMGLNMLGVFPWLRHINPHMPRIFGKKINRQKHKRGPFVVGLLNGLMPCGPLQSMQLYALGTGSFLAGALSMLVFSIGTVPLMFGLGALASVLKSKYMHKMMRVSAVLVIMLGVIMMNRGMTLSGLNLSGFLPAKASAGAGTGAVATVDGDTQSVTTKITSGSYESFFVEKGKPVRWTIEAAPGTVNGCNGTIVVPDYDIYTRLKTGDTVVEFTPEKTGSFVYTCSMGMIRSTITVVDDLAAVTQQDIQKSADSNVTGGMPCCQ